MSDSACGSIRVPRVGSLPARANEASTSKASHARRVCYFTALSHDPNPCEADDSQSGTYGKYEFQPSQELLSIPATPLNPHEMLTGSRSPKDRTSEVDEEEICPKSLIF
jgi:hypothetical protein